MTVALRLHSLVFGICRVTARPQLQADHGDPYALEPSNNLATSVRELLASFRDPTDGSITPAGRDFAYQHGNDAFNQVVIAASNKCQYTVVEGSASVMSPEVAYDRVFKLHLCLNQAMYLTGHRVLPNCTVDYGKDSLSTNRVKL
eukprot:GHVT01032789.1.p1 GENE.GHVT01032789.1~~GHVT01032789.1.p1  ORF type:complete len:145 (-),score=8.39 GHVT01032789.1:401-835(-)